MSSLTRGGDTGAEALVAAMAADALGRARAAMNRIDAQLQQPQQTHSTVIVHHRSSAKDTDVHDRQGNTRKNSSHSMPPEGLSPEDELQWWRNRIAEAESAGGLHALSSPAPLYAPPPSAAGWGEAEAKRSSITDSFVGATSSSSSHRRGSGNKAGGADYLSGAESQRIEERMAALGSATGGLGSGRSLDGYRLSHEAASRAETKESLSGAARRDSSKASK